MSFFSEDENVSACPQPGKCGFILKIVPAKDGTNFVLCTDPTDYSDEIHYHDEIEAKDIHLAQLLYVRNLGRTRWDRIR